jgi:predicted ABC-type ATPase
LNKYCYIIAGPNGAGKTTFAMDLLPEEAKCKHYINADLIAKGLSPFAPEMAALQAGRLMLLEIDKCVKANTSFAFETTLSGLSYSRKIKTWKSLGYKVILYYFSLPAAEMAIERVKLRVSQGGHNIPEKDIRRRFERSINNFDQVYKQLADLWVLFDTSGLEPVQLGSSLENE